VARYPLNQPIRLSTTVRDVTGALTDAGALTLLVKIRNADSTSTTTGTYATPAHDGTGLYHQDVPAADLALLGHYQYTWTATGTGAGVSFGDFDVFDPFEPAVLPLQDAFDALNITSPAAQQASGSEIQQYIATIESCMERMTGGPLLNTTVTERAMMMSDQTVIVVRQRPLVSVTGITGASGGAIDITAGVDTDVNAGTIRRKLALPFFGPFFSWLPQVTVTYVAGWGTQVPAAFNTAARIIIQGLWDTQHGPSARPSMGLAAGMVPVQGFPFLISPMAAELLNGSLAGVPFMTEAYV
jgi:hypothetical protein